MALSFLSHRIIGSGTEYRINGSSVTPKEYQEQLRQIGILIKAKNFLVFQVLWYLKCQINYSMLHVVLFSEQIMCNILILCFLASTIKAHKA